MKSILIILGAVIAVIVLIAAMLVAGMSRIDRQQSQLLPAATQPAEAATTPSDPPASQAAAAPAPAPPIPDPKSDPAPAPAAPPSPPAAEAIVLSADTARIHGYQLRLKKGPHPQIMYWVDGQEYLEWSDAVRTGGDFTVELTYSCAPNAGGGFNIIAGPNRLHGNTEGTGDWKNFKSFPIGKVHLIPGRTSLLLKPDGNPQNGLMNLRMVRLLKDG